MRDFHPLVKQLLDGEVTLGELPAELRPEAEEALRLLAAVPRDPVTLSAGFDERVLAAVRRRRARRGWRWLTEPRELRLRVHPLTAGSLLAAAAALIVFLVRSPAPPPAPAGVTVRFVLFAPEAQTVSVAGTFNQWDAAATPLVRTGARGVWSATITLPAGQHQYAFVVDGGRWVPDPSAPAVDDGFGRRNSVLAL